jgi:hypothetical protein
MSARAVESTPVAGNAPWMVTALWLVGTDIVHAIPLTLGAGAGHVAMGKVDFRLLDFVLPGSVPGVLPGPPVSTKVAVASQLLFS